MGGRMVSGRTALAARGRLGAHAPSLLVALHAEQGGLPEALAQNDHEVLVRLQGDALLLRWKWKPAVGERSARRAQVVSLRFQAAADD